MKDAVNFELNLAGRIAAAFLIFILTILFVRGIAGRVERTEPEKEIYNVETRLLDGYDWGYINSSSIALDEKMSIKEAILRVMIESCMLVGKPVVNSGFSLSGYVNYIDEFYSENGDLRTPVFFVLKSADMKFLNVPEENIDRFKTEVMRRLKNSRLIV